MRYVAIRSEGGLIPYDLLDKIANEDAAGQKPADFGLPKGRRLTDEISRVWADAQSLWSNFKRRRESLGDRDPYGTSITRSWIGSLLGDVDMLGFDLKLQASAVVVNNSTYAISHRGGEGEDAIPVHIEGLKIDLDRRLHTKLRTSPQAMVQDFLNNGEQVLWGIVTNGLGLRILRDSSRTARPTYLEFDLESILEGNRFNEFALLYRVCHRSRFPRAGQDPADCLLERYYQDSVEQGLRVRDKLREGVEETLKILGTAFLQHPTNDSLRDKVSSGQLTAVQFHRQLLLLVYRLLFLMVAEERGLIVSVGENGEQNQTIYDEWYSISRLRDRAAQIIDTSPFGDVWQGLQQTFALFEYGLDTNPLGIPPLNGDLFHQEHAIPDLKGTELYNHELLRAIRHLSLFKDGTVQQRVNYSALDVEELGSVYESLLDYQPVLQPSDKGLVFELQIGAERKSTGSYYTRPELVHELVESALVPVMEGRIGKAEKASEGKSLVEEQKAKIEAILNMSVCDPACGSGHFLLAAARRLGKELARIRTGEDEPRPEDFHLAVRDAIAHCIYGVDLNPLAVDLCKLALWLEGHWAGKPLSFLDHRIRCGNSLVGVLDSEVLVEGIPDEAFTAVVGDDKKVAAAFKKRNKQERTSKQRNLSFEPDDHSNEYAKAKRELTDLAEDSAAAVRRKAELYGSWRGGMQLSHDQAVADLWVAQFFHPLKSAEDPTVCTTSPFLDFATDAAKQPQKVAAAQALGLKNRFFHWHLEFPEVFERGGFDVVLGNPPWEKVKLQEQEFFAVRDKTIAGAQNKASRERMIQNLSRIDASARERALAAEFAYAKRMAEAESHYMRTSRRYPLTGVGDINVYALFAETALELLKPEVGKAGVLIPSGVATDHTTREFFGHMVKNRLLARFFEFENEGFFSAGQGHMVRFAITTLSKAGDVKNTDFVFQAKALTELSNPERHFELSAEEISLLNPNTLTCPIFRTKTDAALTKKIYRAVPVLIEEGNELGNPWGIDFMRMFDMATDSELFKSVADLKELGATRLGYDWLLSDQRYLRLYEAKMIHLYTNRHGSFADAEPGQRMHKLPEIQSARLRDPALLVEPFYWVPEAEVNSRLAEKGWPHGWLMGWRDVTDARASERTVVAAAIPRAGCGDKFLLMMANAPSPMCAALLGNLSSLPLDYVARQKVGGIALKYFTMKQLPVLPPTAYQQTDMDFIVARVLELSYTSVDMEAFAQDLGHRGAPFVWNDDRRLKLCAELDAYYAHLYSLSREELGFILDPADIFGENFPSETFRIMKEREIKEYGEYRTRRLVLETFDELATSQRFAGEVPKRESAFRATREITAAVTN